MKRPHAAKDTFSVLDCGQRCVKLIPATGDYNVSENRLKDSASPYLRSAAHQPIDWHEWGESAFARAKTEDKPILLDIGAVWCHWCHVIDRESYENPEIAKIINGYFVPIKWIAMNGRT